MQYYSNTFVCVHHEEGVSRSLIIDICVNNAIFSAILKNDIYEIIYSICLNTK